MRPKMRQVLELAAREEIRRVFDVPHGQPKWPAPWQTLNALERKGFVERTERLSKAGHRIVGWRATDAGKAALRPRDVYRVEPPIYLSRGAVRYRILPNGRWAVDESASTVSGDYTTDPRKSIDRERKTAVPVLVRPEDLDDFTIAARQRENERKREQGEHLDTEPLDKRVTKLERIAKDRRADVSGELRLVRHMLSNGREKHALQRIERLETDLGQRAA